MINFKCVSLGVCHLVKSWPEQQIMLYQTFDKSYVGSITQDGKRTVVPEHNIIGIPLQIKHDTSLLEGFLKHTSVVLSKLSNTESKIYIKGKLLGGGSEWSRTMGVYEVAKQNKEKQFFSEAERHYTTAIQKLEALKQTGNYLNNDLELSEKLRDSYFSQGMMRSLLNRIPEAIESFRKATELGSSEATIKIDELNTKLEINKKKKKEADLAMLAELPYQSTVFKLPWSTGFSLGMSTNLSKDLKTRICSTETTLTPTEMQQTHFEYLISEDKDITSNFNIGTEDTGTFSNPFSWCINFLTDYTSTLKLEGNSIYALIGDFYTPSYQHTFKSGTLNESASLYLSKHGFEKFKSHYGSHFVGGYIEGAIFLGCLTIKAETAQKASELKHQLKGGVLSNLLNGNVHGGSSQLENLKSHITQVALQVRGANPMVGTISNLADLQQKHKEFGEKLKDFMTPAVAICQPWTAIEEVEVYVNDLRSTRTPNSPLNPKSTDL
jgi:hypothetical protein